VNATIEIRRARHDDRSLHWSLDEPGAEPPAEGWRDHETPGHVVLNAILGGEVVGSAHLAILPTEQLIDTDEHFSGVGPLFVSGGDTDR
jgi:hypothetical protein